MPLNCVYGRTQNPCRDSDERGAVFVELAVVGMVLAVMAFGVLEYGLFLRQSTTVADAVRSGTRTAAVVSSAPSADFQILSAMKQSSYGLAGHIDRVVIYKAGANGQPLNPTCLTYTPVIGQCNVYSGADFDSGEAVISAKSITQNGWKPSSRSPGVDFIGVRVEARHDFFTGLFGASVNFSDKATVLTEGAAPAATPSNNGFTAGGTPLPPAGVEPPMGACIGCAVTIPPTGGING